MQKNMLMFLLASVVIFSFGSMAYAGGGCTTTDCHAGLEEIVPTDLPMSQQLKMNGQMHGDPDGCVMCHGGNPTATKKEEAHKGVPATLRMAPGPKDYYPDPGSIWISDNTCGICHVGYTYRAKTSLMNTEAGKISGNMHTWGFEETANFKNPWGNYAITDQDGQTPMIGTKAYKSYMKDQISMYPNQYPKKLDLMPNPSVEEVKKDPKKAAFAYQRQDCNRCHIGVRGREKRGDYRGMGCSACHILYSNDGYYEGKDKSIKPDEKGHMLKHQIIGNRKTGGIPVETCSSCHNRGKRIGVSFQGLMEFPYGSPFNETGGKQPKLHTKKYMFVSDDLHHQQKSRKGNPEGGLLCQDCHTSIDMHGDGNIHGTTMGQVEIECTDCHGTPKKYPWELPIGYGDEFGKKAQTEARGTAEKLLIVGQQFGYPYAVEDGFLLSARGNPLGNVVRRGNKVIVHSATGNDFEVPDLKGLALGNKWKDPSAEVAMSAVSGHLEKLECYTCHASWAPQCYGCHVKVDYSNDKNGKQKGGTDWIASGNSHDSQGQTAESKLGAKGIFTSGKPMESRSYLRWEDPVLGIGGEGRVTPLMPGCQVVYTVIDDTGAVIANNMIADAPDEAKYVGQEHVPLAIDMSPVQPHTAQRQARTCESCHGNAKVAGLGIGNGTFSNQQNKDVVFDLMNAKTGEIIPEKYTVQIQAIPKLDFDWSQIVTRDGTQLATVGSHWPLSRAFNKEEIDTFMRTGTCMGCHQNMSKMELWEKVSKEGKLDYKKHQDLMSEMLKNMAKNAPITKK